jgi:hypothetical protein
MGCSVQCKAAVTGAAQGCRAQYAAGAIHECSTGCQGAVGDAVQAAVQGALPSDSPAAGHSQRHLTVHDAGQAARYQAAWWLR